PILIEPRRKQRRAIRQMEAEHHRRQQEAAERKAQVELESKREIEREKEREAHQRRLRDLELRVRERFGNDALLPGDLELADCLLADSDWATMVYRCGKPISRLHALAEGERWADQFCRQMALAERSKRALDQGRIRADDALALAKLISADEESARRQIEEMEGRPVKYRDRLTESFWLLSATSEALARLRVSDLTAAAPCGPSLFEHTGFCKQGGPVLDTSQARRVSGSWRMVAGRRRSARARLKGSLCPSR